MKIGKHLFAGLLMVAIALPLAAQDKQYDVKLHVYPQGQKAEPAAKVKKESRPETAQKAECCEEAAACPAGQGKMQGKPAGKMQDCGQCDKMGAGQCDKMGGQCCEKGAGQCDKMGGDQCGMMQGCPQGGPQQGMRPMGHGAGMQFGNSVQYREFRRRQLADFEGKRFYLGTNVLALVVGMPNINAEWRRDEKMGVRLSVGGSFWAWDEGATSVGGFWFNPEVRWYLGETKGWYAGPMAKIGYIGADGERQTSIAVGATLGYMQRVSKKFAVDYNVGVGFSAIGHHDTYVYDNYGYATPTTEWGTRFAPLKIGISLVWQTCSKSY